MYSYLFTETRLKSFLFGMSAMAPNILCNCADRRFIDVCSYKGPPLVKQQYSLSQMDDCWIRKEHWEERDKIVSGLYSLCLIHYILCFFMFLFFFADRGVCFGEWKLLGPPRGTVAILVPSPVGDYRAEVRAAHLDNRVLFGTVEG